jgi:hypothetical protein
MILKMMFKLCIRKGQGTTHCRYICDFQEVKRNKFALTNMFLCSINFIMLYTAPFFGFSDSKCKVVTVSIMKAYGGVEV